MYELTNTAIRTPTRGRNSKYTFPTMEIGDEFQVEGRRALKTATASASKYKTNHPGWNYVAVLIDNTGYVQRIA